jgi:hypothetical protein
MPSSAETATGPVEHPAAIDQTPGDDSEIQVPERPIVDVGGSGVVGDELLDLDGGAAAAIRSRSIPAEGNEQERHELEAAGASGVATRKGGRDVHIVVRVLEDERQQQLLQSGRERGSDHRLCEAGRR